ncbi:MAG: hypothetical protein WCG77_02315 [Actinomycetes bacterium]
MTRSHAAALVAFAALSTTLLAGCWNGPGSTTMMQASMNSGNGVQATVGPIKVENATLVAGPEGTTTATLTARIINTGQAPDALVYVVIANGPAYVTPGSETFAPNASLSFGFDSQNWINTYTLKAATGTYVPVELGFKDAGLVKISVLVVPPVGYYKGIAPNPATLPSATPGETAVVMPSDSAAPSDAAAPTSPSPSAS